MSFEYRVKSLEGKARSFEFRVESLEGTQKAVISCQLSIIGGEYEISR